MKTYLNMQRLALGVLVLGTLLMASACSDDGGISGGDGDVKSCGEHKVYDASGNCVCEPFYTLQPDGTCTRGSDDDDDDDDVTDADVTDDDDDNQTDGDGSTDDDDDVCGDTICGTNAHCENGTCVCDDGFSGDPNAACTQDATDGDTDAENPCTCPAPPQATYCIHPDDAGSAGYRSVRFGPGSQSGCNVSISMLNGLGEEAFGGEFTCDENGEVSIANGACLLSYREAQELLVLTCGDNVYRFSKDYAPCDVATDGDEEVDQEDDPACLNVVCGTHAHCEGGDCFCDPGYSGDPDVACSLPSDGDVDEDSDSEDDSDGDLDVDEEDDMDGDIDGDEDEDNADTPCVFDDDCGPGRYCWIITDPNECRCQCGAACGNVLCDEGSVCDDHGRCVLSLEDGDIEEDEEQDGLPFGEACSLDDECQMGLYCKNTTCGYDCNPPELNCASMAFCDDRGRCQLDMCIGQSSPPCCNKGTDCPQGQYCGNNSCAYDCLNDTVCSGDTCCSEGYFCNSRGQCEEGDVPDGDVTTCTEQTEASLCHPQGKYCDPQLLICVMDCEDEDDCFEGEDCVYGECVTEEPGCVEHEMCNVGFKCDMEGDNPTYECVPGCPTVDVCEGMYVCNGHVCAYNPEAGDEPVPCESTSECPVYHYCPDEESHPDYGFCTQDCDPDEPTSCPDGEQCLLNGKCGICSDFGDCPEGQFCGCPPGQSQCAMEEQVCVEDGCQTDEDCASQGHMYCCREGLTYGTTCTEAQYGQCVFDCYGNANGCDAETERCNEIGICEEADTCPNETDEECDAGYHCDLQTTLCVQDCNAETPCEDDNPDDSLVFVCDESLGRCNPVFTCVDDNECAEDMGSYYHCAMDDETGFNLCQSECNAENVLDNCLEGEMCTLEGRCVPNECEADWECACSHGQDPSCSTHEYCQELAEGGRICTFECQTNADCPSGSLCDYNGICQQTHDCDAATYCQPVLPLNPPPAEHDYPLGGGIITYCDLDAAKCTYDCTEYGSFGGTCSGESVCAAGRCAECATNEDCPDNHYCEIETRECKFLALCDTDQADPDADCKAINPTMVCVGDRCETGCQVDDDCKVTQEGVDVIIGYCRAQECQEGDHCPSFCSRDCDSNSDCGNNEYCNDYGRCIYYRPPCADHTDCARGSYCDAETGSCLIECFEDSECSDGQSCNTDRGVCGTGSYPDQYPSCATDEDCPFLSWCDSGTCQTSCDHGVQMEGPRGCGPCLSCSLERGKCDASDLPNPADECRSRCSGGESGAVHQDCPRGSYCVLVGEADGDVEDGYQTGICRVDCFSDADCSNGDTCDEDRGICGDSSLPHAYPTCVNDSDCFVETEAQITKGAHCEGGFCTIGCDMGDDLSTLRGCEPSDTSCNLTWGRCQ